MSIVVCSSGASVSDVVTVGIVVSRRRHHVQVVVGCAAGASVFEWGSDRVIIVAAVCNKIKWACHISAVPSRPHPLRHDREGVRDPVSS